MLELGGLYFLSKIQFNDVAIKDNSLEYVGRLHTMEGHYLDSEKEGKFDILGVLVYNTPFMILEMDYEGDYGCICRVMQGEGNEAIIGYIEFFFNGFKGFESSELSEYMVCDFVYKCLPPLNLKT